MEILAPINSVRELIILHSHGVREFYCGYISNEWICKFNSNENCVPVSPNRRYTKTNNIYSKVELTKISELSKKFNCKVYITINTPGVPEIGYPEICGLLDDLKECGITRVILSDLGLINYIYTSFPDFKITISCLAQVLNKWTVDFYSQFKPERIVFPRHIEIKEMENIIAAYPHIEFECFGLSGKCIYNDGNCRCSHAAGPICMERNVDADSIVRIRESDSSAKEVYNNLLNYYEWQTPTDNLDNYGCSLCSVLRLAKYSNFTSIKLVGRAKDINKKISEVEICKSAILQIDNNVHKFNRNKVIEWFQKDENFCSSGLHCIMRGD